MKSEKEYIGRPFKQRDDDRIYILTSIGLQREGKNSTTYDLRDSIIKIAKG